MRKIGILIGFVALCLIGCSKDKNDVGINPNGNGNAGAPFTYHFKILEGEDAGFEMSGEVPNSECISMYFSENGNAEKTISFIMNHDNKMSMGAGIRTDSSGNFISTIEDEEGAWTLAMLPINKSFFLNRVNINVSNVSYSGLPQSGYASFKLEFEGQFHQNIDEDDLYKISGTIVANYPPM